MKKNNKTSKISQKQQARTMQVFLHRVNVVVVLLMMTIMMLIIEQPQTIEAINSVLDIDGVFPYLKNNLTGAIIEPRDYMDFDNIYTPNETYRLQQTAQGRNYHMLKAFDFANYFQSDYWHYSKREDLLASGGPPADELKCARHLNWLEGQLNASHQLFAPGQQHIQLMTLIDSYGHPETTTYNGHGYWLGSYHECKRAQLKLGEYEFERCVGGSSSALVIAECRNKTTTATSSISDETLKFRYCIGKAHDIDWPQTDNYTPRISYKVGLCLPETCETLSFERGHASQLERLMRLNMPDYMRSRIHLHELYCLPDERSSLRQLPLSARIFLTIIGTWLALLVVATCLHSSYKRHQRDLHEILIVSDQDGGANETERPNGISSPTHQANKNIPMVVVAAAAVAMAEQQEHQDEQQESNNKLLLLNVNKTTAAAAAAAAGEDNNQLNVSQASVASSCLSNWLDEKPFLVQVLQALSIKETIREFSKPPKMLDEPNAKLKMRVNLNALDAIKCLCCVLVIFGHIVFIHMQHLSNIVHTIELSHEIYPRALISFFNFVDTFFIISGMLTAYFIFKRFNRRTFGSPVIWLSVSLLRLLRLSPVYILVLWFIKSTLVYTFEGPIWDYGTDKNSIKGLCINDHWWKSVLYLGNWGTMQPLCILPAWSIIVDAQYSLVIPVVIYLIFRNKQLGYVLLMGATLISTTKMTFQLAEQTAVKTSDMAKIRLHVYPLISRFAAEFYNTAWNRIGPVAVGIFGGHMLYLYELGTIREWPRFMHGLAFKFVLAMHVLIFALPAIGRFTDDPQSTSETDQTIFILSNATIKPIWSIINTILLLRLITDLRHASLLARLMSHNIWHCLGKLCFTSYLIHYEIILTMLKSRHEGLIDPNWPNALREFAAAFMISTLISYIIYNLYEAPVNKLIMLFLNTSKYNPTKRKHQVHSSPHHLNHHHHHQHHHQQQQQLYDDPHVTPIPPPTTPTIISNQHKTNGLITS